MSQQADKKAIYKLSQFYQALYERYLDYEYYLEIINKEGDVNHRLPDCKFLKSNNPQLIGSTLLHLAVDTNESSIFHNLLSQGADFTIKNGNGSNVLHLAVNKCDKRLYGSYNFDDVLNDPFIDTLLAIQMKSGNFENPCDPNGISHFHAACMTNNVQAVKFFLDNGVSVNQAISRDSPMHPEYTPLHIAAKCGNVETAEILLNYGADTSLKDSKEMTPLHILLKENMDIINSHKYKNQWEKKRPLKHLERNEQIIKLILAIDQDIEKSTGLTPLHIVCTMKDISKVENILKNNVDINASVKNNYWNGYTALHFAMFFNLDVVKLLIEKGARIDVKDKEGETPFDICLKHHDIKDVHSIMSIHSIGNNLLLSDGKTKLVDFVDAIQDLETFKLFLEKNVGNINIQISASSWLWSGCTLLHVILHFYSQVENHFAEHMKQLYHRIITECLVRGSDISIEDSNGCSSLQLAMKLKKKKMVHLLFQHQSIVKNIIDSNEFSYLHIACGIKNKGLINKLLRKEANVNQATKSSLEWSDLQGFGPYGAKPRMQHVPAGATPLHMAVASGCYSTVKMLLKHGANADAKDCNGMTPVHYILISPSYKDIEKALLSSPNLTDSIARGGLNYLHIASLTNNVKVVEMLLDAGVDIDSMITYESENDKDSEDPIAFLSKYKGYNALHFAMEFNSTDTVKLLIQRGADIFANYRSLIDDTTITPLYDVLEKNYSRSHRVRDDLLSRLLRDDAVQKRMFQETGLTMLHVFCHEIDIDSIKVCLTNKADVNAQAHLDSPIWPGCTALQILLKSADSYVEYDRQLQDNVTLILELLLNHGANVLLQDAQSDTVIHVADRILRSYNRDNLTPNIIRQQRVKILLEQLEDFTINPVNNEGVSHFHIVCNLNCLGMIKAFLDKGADVNQSTDYFSIQLPGWTPLHFAINSLSKRSFGISNQLEVIDTLLRHGADVNAEDSIGKTPLHVAAQNEPPRKALFESLVGHGSDIYAKNILAKTAFEILLISRNATTEEIEFYLKQGFSANVINHVSKEGYLAMSLYKKMDGIIYTLNFETMVNSLDLSKPGDTSHTAIHNVVSTRAGSMDMFEYVDIIENLKSIGCDIDYQDKSGQTALHIATHFRNWNAVSGLLRAGIDVEIVDLTGKSAFDYVFESSSIVKKENCYDNSKVNTMACFVFHVHKMQHFKFHISEVINTALEEAMKVSSYFYGYSLTMMKERLDDELERAKNTKIVSNSLTLHHFLSETGAVANFPIMIPSMRETVTKFFEHSHRHTLHLDFNETAGLLKLQYRKALARLPLMKSAEVSLRILLEFPLPDPCSKAVLRFLTNSELKSLIESTT